MPSFTFTLVDDASAPASSGVIAGGNTPPVKRDFQLDPGGDLDLTKGDLFFTTGGKAIAQSCLIRLRTVLGEWFLDELNVGTPYFEDVLVKNPNLDVIRSTLRERILGTLGVSDLLSMNLDYSSSDRALQVGFVAQTDAGLLEVTLQADGQGVLA